jgi:hypothetical protein
MAVNPNLVPTPRVDSNGKTTTRHMKAEPSSTDAGSVPLPVSSPDLRPISIGELDEYVWELCDQLDIPMEEAAQTMMYANLQHISQAMPRRFSDLTERLEHAEDHERKLWGEVLRSRQLCPLESDDEQFDFSTLVDRHLQLVPFTSELFKDEDYESSRWSYDAETEMRDAVKSVLKNADPDDYDMMKAAVLATWVKRGPWNNPTPPNYARDFDDLVYIADHLDDAMRVRDEMKTRNSIDRELIATLSKSASIALLEGML